MTLSIEEVISKFPQEVRDRYDFTNAVYHGALKPITGIVCATHGEFKQYAAQLRRGSTGCPKCGGEVRAAKKRLSPEEYIRRATEAHDGFYTYERTEFFNTTQPITVTCPQHGDFTISPNNHLYGGQGCPACGSAKRGHRSDPVAAARLTADRKLEEHALRFEQDARKIHGDAYDYSRVIYHGRRKPVEIVCPKHGSFYQTPQHHLYRAHGCPECSHHRSKGESAIVDFVSIFCTPVVRDRKTIAPYELDIYIPEHNLAIEYCGEYWHGTKSEDDERVNKNRHYEKFKACEAKGIRLLTVYESEWHDNPEAIKRLIRSAMGKMRGAVMARKCDLVAVGNSEASAFFDKYHIQGGSGYGSHYGLRYNGKLVACMRFAYGANDRGKNSDRVWTLSRYATRIKVTGGASRLLKAFIESHNPESIKSFSDNRYFTGALYERLGFMLEEHTAPDYQVWHQRLGLLPKTAWQRKAIPARIRELDAHEKFEPETDPRSERQMTFALGARRMFDCGKKRWMLRLA